MTEQEHENETPATPENLTDSVRDLIEMMNKGGIGELNLKTEEFKISLRTEAVALATASPVVSMPPAYPMPPMPGVVPAAAENAPAAAAENAPAAAADEAPAEKDGHVVTSPMIGTFYSASAPGEPAYVQVGDEVETGQVIGIIEAMKIMNEITADTGGIVVEILVENAEPVEYGSPLIRIASSSALD